MNENVTQRLHGNKFPEMKPLCFWYCTVKLIIVRGRFLMRLHYVSRSPNEKNWQVSSQKQDM